MKRYLLFFSLIYSSYIYCQPDMIPKHDLDPYNPAFVKGEVIVRFKDSVTIGIDKSKGYYSTGLQSVDLLFRSFNPLEIKKVFTETSDMHENKLRKKNLGNNEGKISASALFNIYKLKFNHWVDIKTVISQLQNDENVLYAEPNYLVYSNEIDHLTDETYVSGSNIKSPANTIPNDPYFQNGSQAYLNQINAPAAWDIVTGDTNQIIAIIDTGVDWDHPDLDDNIWINYEEIPENGIDDDNNGYIDDNIGWDFVNSDNNPDDDNSHGTHVAGIAAAEGNNGIGISGVTWNSKIMALKVLQSSGSGSSTALASAIEYAANMGATVVNMSLGSYGESLTVKNALENAYAGTGDGLGSMLVAAAGNNHLKVSMADPCQTYGASPMPMYPAAYSWVIGVMAFDAGPCNGFSNWDFDGVVAFNQVNYEMASMGVNILSCKLNGENWQKSGTSMATPQVAGAVALLRQFQPDLSGEQIFAKLIQSSESGHLDIFKALTSSLHPQLHFVSATIVDDQAGSDNDGIADAGETFQFYFTVMNAGSQADSVWAKLSLGEFEDPTIASVNDSTSTIGNLSTYTTLDGSQLPFEISINPLSSNNREISFDYEIGYQNNSFTTGQIVITIQKGIELGGVITSDITLVPENLYLLTGNLRVSEEACLTILPGTTIKFLSERAIDVRGKIIAIGKPDSLIRFESEDESHFGNGIFINNQFGSDTSMIRYSEFYQLNYPINTQYVFNNSYFKFHDNIIRACRYKTPLYNSGISVEFQNNIEFYRNIFIDNYINGINVPYYLNQDMNVTFKENVIVNNLINELITPRGFNLMFDSYFTLNSQNTQNVFFSNYLYNQSTQTITNEENMYVYGGGSTAPISNNYWGRNDSILINQTIFDFDNNFNLPSCVYNPVSDKPSAETHGLVWKVTINDIPVNKFDNPYNSVVGLGIVGAEIIKFDVFFNRAMDISHTPLLTFGTREPFTQHIISDNSEWSADSTKYTAFYTIDMTTGDGLQRIRVANAVDNENFTIPTENKRFEFVIQAAAAANVNFFATAGIGKVNLGWPSTLSEDVLGYNLYRFTTLNDSTNSDTLRINNELILDTIYTDHNVLPGALYNYLYRTLSTNMTETDYSKKVTAVPLSASPGDANGDQSVNILDITTIVAFILNQNPQPFLLAAADINQDGSINLLDIIGVVNLVMGGKTPDIQSNPAVAYLEPNQILFESDGTLTGFEFQLIGSNLQQLVISPSVSGFEFIHWLEGDTLNAILFSMNNQTIPAGQVELFKLSNLDQMPQWGVLFAGNADGDYVPVNKSITSLPEDYRYSFKAYPNPGKGVLTLDIQCPEMSNVELTLYDKLGRSLLIQPFISIPKGNTNLNFDLRNFVGSNGIYFLSLRYLEQNKATQSYYRKVIKLIISN